MVKFSEDLWDGFEPLNAKTDLGLQVFRDVADFAKKRALLENEYGKKLQELCKTSPGAGLFSKTTAIDKESTTVRNALKSWQEQGTKQANHHIDFANKINNDIVKPLEAFVKGKDPERKKIIADGQKRLAAYAASKKAHDQAKAAYLAASKEAEAAAEAHEKSKADLESAPEARKKQLGENEKRAGQKETQTADKAKAAEAAYQKAVDALNDLSKETYGTHLPPVLEALQKLEEERYAQAQTVVETFQREFRALPEALLERAEDLKKALEALSLEADFTEYVDAHKSTVSEPEIFKFLHYKEPQPTASTSSATSTTTTTATESDDKEKTTEVDL